MRPSFGWGDVGSFGRVGVWGLGVEGEVNRRRLIALGIEPVLVDDRPGAPEVVATGEGGLELLAGCGLVIKSPGISRYRDDLVALERDGTPVVGGLGLWLAEAPLDRVVCVTGTKGKSTTVSIAGHLATGLGVRSFVGGNLGAPPFAPEAPTDVDLWIIEVSSYQATDVGVTPPVVAVTSLHADHLDWHGSDDVYFRDKLSLTSQPGARLTVAGDDERLRALRGRLGPEVRWVGADDAGAWADGLGLVGRHNAVNAAMAAIVLAEAGVAGADDPERLAVAAQGFPGLESRLRLVATVDGVEFYDDSLSTNVLPTMAAIGAFPDRPVAVILGGFDRGIDYEPLADYLVARTAPTLALTLPASGDRIAAALGTKRSELVEVVPCDDLDAAVDRGFAWARPGGVVLLSPAAPSFGQFRDYRDRAHAFVAAVARQA